MAGKARVHELAKELGVTSKEVLAKLSELGEFVKSASSTVEARSPGGCARRSRPRRRPRPRPAKPAPSQADRGAPGAGARTAA